MNSSIKTRLQDSYPATQSYTKPHEYVYTTFSRSIASEISIPSQTTAHNDVTEVFNQRIIISDQSLARQRNIDSLNNPRLKPLYLLQTHKLKPLHLVIKHREILDKKIANQQDIIRRNKFQQIFDTRQREKHLLENFRGQGLKDERILMKLVLSKLKKDDLNEKADVKRKGKQVEICEGNEENDLSNDDIYEDLTIYDIIEMFKTLNGDYNYVNYINE
ncbi:10446_t:CDS:2 [Funneliformis caledonium]|uniref:10446_t:CDS:1 n=1 Tax=Funneliformis caledonium TaxID=1117310 RepID=A0A9N9F7P3_9GLOM|nr:10446_t:CDS:2 [Funneliformis caledonium]